MTAVLALLTTKGVLVASDSRTAGPAAGTNFGSFCKQMVFGEKLNRVNKYSGIAWTGDLSVSQLLLGGFTDGLEYPRSSVFTAPDPKWLTEGLGPCVQQFVQQRASAVGLDPGSKMLIGTSLVVAPSCEGTMRVGKFYPNTLAVEWCGCRRPFVGCGSGWDSSALAVVRRLYTTVHEPEFATKVALLALATAEFNDSTVGSPVDLVHYYHRSMESSSCLTWQTYDTQSLQTMYARYSELAIDSLKTIKSPECTQEVGLKPIEQWGTPAVGDG